MSLYYFRQLQSWRTSPVMAEALDAHSQIGTGNLFLFANLSDEAEAEAHETVFTILRDARRITVLSLRSKSLSTLVHPLYPCNGVLMSRLSEDDDGLSLDPFPDSVGTAESLEDGTPNLTKGQAWSLYLSHSLSMWNSRMYEFGAV